MTWEELAKLYISKAIPKDTHTVDGRTTAYKIEFHVQDHPYYGQYVSRYTVSMGIYLYSLNGISKFKEFKAFGKQIDDAYGLVLTEFIKHILTLRKWIASNDPIPYDEAILFRIFDWPKIDFSSKEELELKLNVL